MLLFVSRFKKLDNRSFSPYHTSVKQEVVIAILAGFLIGAGVAFGIVQLSSYMKAAKVKTTAETLPRSTITLQPTQTDTKQDTGIRITSPKDEEVTQEKSMTIKGSAPAKSTIVLETDTDTFAQDVGDDGAFSFPISLFEGTNLISITGYLPQGAETTQSLTVFYEPSS